MENYCNNCGNFGHVYNTCRHPILSYGIILFNIDAKNICRIVMIERKDSLSFIEFIRGKYKNHMNTSYIKLLVSRMTIEEKENLLSKSFDELWKNLWIHTDNVNQRIQKEYRKSKIIFEQLKKLKGDKCLETIIKNSNMKENYTSNEWEIPKGRRDGHENNKDCAKREIKEETNISDNSYKMINNIIPLIEEYRGINGVRYKHVYYIAEVPELVPLKIHSGNQDQYTEIKNIEWLTEQQCYEKIRNYNIKKKDVIKSFFNFQKKINKEISIKKNIN